MIASNNIISFYFAIHTSVLLQLVSVVDRLLETLYLIF